MLLAVHTHTHTHTHLHTYRLISLATVLATLDKPPGG